jgi:hypothetical protein
MECHILEEVLPQPGNGGGNVYLVCQMDEAVYFTHIIPIYIFAQGGCQAVVTAES